MSSTKKVALITGALKGIGLACAKLLSDEGYQLALHYRSKPDNWKEITESFPENTLYVEGDLVSKETCEGIIKKTQSECSRIDVLINNAGKTSDQLLPFAKVEDFDSILETNLRSAFILSKLAAKAMIKQRLGSIIHISSVVAFTGNKGQCAYSASKSALIGLTKSMALELAPFGIRVNSVAPGFIETDMTRSLSDELKIEGSQKIPLKRFGTPREVAEAVRFLAGDSSSYITGTCLHVNGGLYM